MLIRITAILPIHYFSPHQSAIRSISWIRAPGGSTEDEITADDPTVIVSGGYDGLLAAVDLRMPSANAVYRTRGIQSFGVFIRHCNRSDS